MLAIHITAQVTALEESQYADQMDEILTSNLPDSSKVSLLLERVNDIDVFYSNLPMEYIQKAIDHLSTPLNTPLVAKLYRGKGCLFQNISQKDSAIYYIELALEGFNQLGDTTEMLKLHHILSNFYGSNDSPDKSLQHSIKAMKLAERIGDSTKIADLLVDRSSNPVISQNHSIVRSNTYRALKIYSDNKDTISLFHTNRFLSTYYHNTNVDSAKHYIENAFLLLNNYSKAINDEWINFYSSRIIVLEHSKEYELLEQDLLKLDSINKINYDQKIQFLIDFKRAVNLSNMGKYDDANTLYLNSINHQLAANNPYLLYNYLYLVNNFIAQGRWDLAYQYHIKTHDLDNQEKMHESKMKLEEIKAQYETEKKESLIKSQNEIISQQRVTSWLSLVTAVLLGLFLYIARKNARLKIKANEELEKINTLKNRLYENITHELRTPLTVISGMANQIEDDSEKWLDEGLGMIQRNTDRLLVLVNQMLDLSKLESGNMSLQNEQGDLIQFLKYIVESVHSLAQSKDIRLHFHSEEEELIMDYDPEKFQKIMVNLLSNAIKFTPSGGDVYVLTKAIKSNVKNLIEIKVRDTGMGIPKNQLQHIFERFHQVETKAYNNEGSGIGLAIVKELIQLMKGTIEVKSNIEKYKGTEFTVSLPISNDAKFNTSPTALTEDAMARYIQSIPDIPTSTDKQDNEVKGQNPSNRPSILLIEDNLDVLTYISSCLDKQYDILRAVNGQDGIDMAIEHVPDLIISDIMMPIKNGYEVCHAIKTDTRTSHIPIVMLTAKSDMNSKLEGLGTGAEAYLAKPFYKDELLLRIKKLLELRANLQQYYLSLTNSSATPVEPIKDEAPKHLESKFVKHLMEIIEENLSDANLNVDMLCQTLAMSRSQLNRKTSALTGITPSKLIQKTRLNHAKKLLADPSYNIADVAFESGFNDPSYFGRVFKKEYSTTPQEWRQMSSQQYSD